MSQRKRKRNKHQSSCPHQSGLRPYADYFRMANPEIADAYEIFLLVVELARQGAGFSYVELAELVGSTAEEVAGFVAGRNAVSGEVYQRLKEVLLITFTPDPTPEQLASGEGISFLVDVSGKSHMLN